MPRRGKDPPQLAERFLLLDDVVAKELSDLDYPWNLKDQMKHDETMGFHEKTRRVGWFLMENPKQKWMMTGGTPIFC